MVKNNEFLPHYIAVLKDSIDANVKKEFRKVGATGIIPSYGGLISFVTHRDGRIQINDLYELLLKP
jgi:hypothetical protein